MSPRGIFALENCSGACSKGRVSCPHRDACELPIEEDDCRPPLDRTGALLALACIVASWAVVLILVALVARIWESLPW